MSGFGPPPPPPAVRRTWSVLVAVLTIEILCATYIKPILGLVLVVVMAGLAGLTWACIAVHELGHLAAGWWCGGRFVMWSAGPVLIHRSPNGLVVRWNTSINPLGGVCGVTRTDRGRSVPEWRLFLLAGGVANLLFAGALVIAPIAGWWAYVAWTCAAVSALLGVVNLAPLVRGSDGHLLRSLMRGDAAARRLLALDSISSRMMGGARLADIPEEWFHDLPGPPDGTYHELVARYLRGSRRLSSGDEEGAWEDLSTVAASAPPPIPLLPVRAYACCAVSQLLATRPVPQLSLARQWLDAAGPLGFNPGVRTLASALLARAEGDVERVPALARQAHEELRRHSMGFAVSTDQLAALRGLDFRPD